ncbi:MAG: ycfH [Gammaproteobacteria bacterium]|jgi:TatD DNase family protein|nr:ycfH [Gammaproteobacteria bacterium]
MFLVDSHCHLDQLDLTAYNGQLSGALANAASQDVRHMLCVCINLQNFPLVLNVAEQYPHISASVGHHPNEEAGALEPTADHLAQLAQHEKIVAIGETGLDYYRSTGDLSWQHERFRQHIRAAKKVNKALIIHSRQARVDTLRILEEEEARTVGGVMHCFTEDIDMANAAIELGFYISFSGIVTFPNAKEIQAVAKQIPLDRMLIETDAPYLAPVPYRGKPNEPSYVRKIAEYIAELRGIDVIELADQTTHNFFNCFKQARR